MNIFDRAKILQFHFDRIKDFGTGTTDALGWSSTENQQKRFEILSKIGELENRTILDVGCGNGDLLAFLRARHPKMTYSGIDFVPQFLDQATERFQDDVHAKFFLGDFSRDVLPCFDYVLASGSLNYRTANPKYVFEAIKRLFSICRLGLGFNLLRGPIDKSSLLVSYEPKMIVDFCRTLTPNVVLNAEYADHDYTVFAYPSSTDHGPLASKTVIEK